jgi:hypothetical protein
MAQVTIDIDVDVNVAAPAFVYTCVARDRERKNVMTVTRSIDIYIYHDQRWYQLRFAHYAYPLNSRFQTRLQLQFISHISGSIHACSWEHNTQAMVPLRIGIPMHI